jgi:predicted dehydrogenase
VVNADPTRRERPEVRFYSGKVAITIGLAGAGHRAASVHITAISSCPQTRLGGVWAPRDEAARDLAHQHGTAAFGSFRELLDGCDAVAFAVPPMAQPDLAALAAEQGRAVLLEVPVAADLDGAQRLAEAIAAAGVVSQLALGWRYAAGIRQFVTATVPHVWPQGGSARLISAALAPGSAVSPWRAEMGVLRNLGPHLIDLLEAALGRIEQVRAHGDPAGWVGLMIEHAEGRFSEASLTATANVKTPRADIEIFGSGGSASVEAEAAVTPGTYQTMYQEFAGAVTASTPPQLDAQHGLRLQEITEEAHTDLA